MDKNQLRKEVRNRKRQFDIQKLGELSFAVIMQLLKHPKLKQAQTIMLYHSLPDEVCTHTLADSLLAIGKTIVMPRVTGNATMELRMYSGPKSLAVGAYGIMEPIGGVFNDYAAIDLAIIPGMAFDKEGNRLGRGKGYYDRFLPNIANAYKIGLAFGFQMFSHIPTDSNDIKMNEVIADCNTFS